MSLILTSNVSEIYSLLNYKLLDVQKNRIDTSSPDRDDEYFSTPLSLGAYNHDFVGKILERNKDNQQYAV